MAMQAKTIPLSVGQNGLSDAQIDRFAKEFKEMLRANRQEFPRSVVDDVFERKTLLSLVREYITEETGLITRHVAITQSAAALPGWEKHVDRRALSVFRPSGTSAAAVWFFRPPDELTHAELEAEYRFHGLRPADLSEFGSVIAAEPDFADRHGCATVATDGGGAAYHCVAVLLEGKRTIFIAPTLGRHSTLLYAGVPL